MIQITLVKVSIQLDAAIVGIAHVLSQASVYNQAMSFSILSSNRIETLQQSMCLHLEEQPLVDPFAGEIIVVPTFAMARWLNLQQAQQQGIAANIHYPQAADWIWELAASLLEQVPHQNPLPVEKSAWKIYSLLPDYVEHPAFGPIRQYLNDDDQGVKRWQLANRIAEVFDRYQHYRPKMIREWSAGGEDHWQARLWRALTGKQTPIHRTEILDQLTGLLHSEPELSKLPERVSLFAISSLPPAYIDIILALSRNVDIRFYQHSPTDQYWADLKSSKAQARRRLSSPQQVEFDEAGNELLASWGRQGQVLQDMLLDQDSFSGSDLELYRPPGVSSLLSSIQQSIFTLDADTAVVAPDASLMIHQCHSPMRECQVLHDQILAMLDRDADLSTEDILVMVPEISRYAPYIEAVFEENQNHSRPGLRWNLSDISLAAEHPLVLIFLQILRLPGSRFQYSEISAYLEIEEIRLRFGIDEAELADIQSMLEESQVRWGIDAAHKASLKLPPSQENTWQQARARIFAGYAFANSQYWQGIAPLHGIEGDRAQSMGKFWLLFERLLFWRELLSQPCVGHEWQSRLNRLIEDLFLEADPRQERLQQIRDAVSQLALAQQAQVSPRLLSHWMETQLANQQSSGRLFSGGVTFCGMRPMRSLPFRVICLLGMNDGVFPRRESPVEFDLMADPRYPGDPSKAQQDRYLMLETLLCARQRLYISYCARSQKDNSERQPSVLVQELIDFVNTRFEFSDKSIDRISDAITTLHPMQTFGIGNFRPPAISYDKYWCSIASKMLKPLASKALESWPDQALPPDPELATDISLLQMHRFLHHPVRYFFNQRLNLWLGDEQGVEDDESFSLEGLEKWKVKARLVQDFLSGGGIGSDNLRAEGRLPHGHAAIESFEQIKDDIDGLLVELQPYRGQTRAPRDFEFRFDEHTVLSGKIEPYFPSIGLMRYITTSMKGKDLISLWIDHLALCASDQFEDQDSSTLIWPHGRLQIGRLGPGEARAQLFDYLSLYRSGMGYPLPVFQGASYSWSVDENINKALSRWNGNSFNNIPGDKDDPYVRLAMRGSVETPIPGAEFEACANRIYACVHDSTITP